MRDKLQVALTSIFGGIDQLREISDYKRHFTIDGRLVGDIGEIIAAREFDITLDGVQQKLHDGVTSDGRKVQIKATFKDSLTIRQEPVLYLGLKLYKDGSHEVIYNGPGRILTDAFGHRKGYGKELLSFPIQKFQQLSQKVSAKERVPRRIS
ncbi:DUF6998 domain-containing protein [Microvirga flavescens]|uniref:DUF6998 domain-containing protein n=1 Tax=Microvirga flavescens TaxID=2249811 RepID=UPI000DD7BDDE|nr:hypothetical protein [Microvirga flavescens]